MLSNDILKKAKPKEKPYKLSDSQGLYLLVKPDGKKYWRYKYRIKGKEKTFAIGTAKDFSLKEARKRHKVAHQQVLDGLDPSAERQNQKIQSKLASEHSFQKIAELWFNTKHKQWDAKHAQKLWRSLELHVFKHLGRTSIHDIKPPMVLAVIRRIEAQGSTDLSHRVLQRMSAIFQYAIHSGIAEVNPASELRGALQPHKSEHFPAIAGDELPLFFERLTHAKTSELNKLAIRLLAHTFVRQCELRRAKWHEFDTEAALWTIPAEHTKMKRSHLVPLAKQTLELLSQIHSITGDSEYVFPSQNRQNNPYMSEGTITRVLKDMGYKGKMVGHGFRALATTELYEARFSEDVVERQMQHAMRDKVRGSYDRAKLLDERTRMMQWWASFLEGRVQSNNPSVIAFKQHGASKAKS